ncbi:MAG: hypothetical protein LC792_07390 [Actinobacteria bacterium]|nr:hypothetical protein [Actinomycetota bacterium]
MGGSPGAPVVPSKEFNVFKTSRRAMVIAASFALGVSAVGPAAHAGLLGGDNSDSPTVEGVGLPVGGDILGNLLGGGLLGGGIPVVGPLLNGELLGSEDGLLGGVLGADGLLGGALFDGGIPVVGGLLDGDGGLLAGAGIVDALPDLSFVPGLGSVTEILQEFSASGSLVPGLQVLDETGILGVLGSL